MDHGEYNCSPPFRKVHPLDHQPEKQFFSLIMPSLSDDIASKSVAAALSGIEIYNKPDFKYREETFAILMTNAWELLLKAKLLKDSQENVESLIEYENVKNPTDPFDIIRQPKLNRSGNPITFGLTYLLEKLIQQPTSGLTKPAYDNILILIEVRDNSIHFLNKDLFFSKRVQEIGTASLRNYLALVTLWFGIDMSRYNFYLMPLSFFHGFEAVESMSVANYNDQMKNFLQYVATVENEHSSSNDSGHQVTLSLELKFVRSKDAGALPFRWTDDPSAPAISVREEDILKSFPYDYKSLTSSLRDRYIGFGVNQEYHRLRKRFEPNPKLCKVRYLDPSNPKSAKKNYFSSEIFKEFDKHYKKKGTA
jgi:hypothetical protein